MVEEAHLCEPGAGLKLEIDGRKVEGGWDIRCCWAWLLICVMRTMLYAKIGNSNSNNIRQPVFSVGVWCVSWCPPVDVHSTCHSDDVEGQITLLPGNPEPSSPVHSNYNKEIANWAS